MLNIPGVKITAIILGVVTFALIGYDVFAVVKWGGAATLSTVITSAAMKIPAISFAFGFLTGHLFGQSTSFVPDQKKGDSLIHLEKDIKIAHALYFGCVIVFLILLIAPYLIGHH